MSKIRHWIIIILIFLTVMLFNYIHRKKNNTLASIGNYSVFKIKHSDTLIYNQEGILSYHLIAQYAEYFPKHNVSWFNQLRLIIYDKNRVPIWSIKSDQANLINGRILYLYGHVEINSLNDNLQLQKIVTDRAQINLITQDVTSQNPVTLHGKKFKSKGLKMRGNLRSRSAELIRKVSTYYEIENK